MSVAVEPNIVEKTSILRILGSSDMLLSRRGIAKRWVKVIERLKLVKMSKEVKKRNSLITTALIIIAPLNGRSH